MEIVFIRSEHRRAPTIVTRGDGVRLSVSVFGPSVGLTDEQWKVLEPLISDVPRRADGRGQPWRSRRELLNERGIAASTWAASSSCSDDRARAEEDQRRAACHPAPCHQLRARDGCYSKPTISVAIGVRSLLSWCPPLSIARTLALGSSLA